VKDALTSSDREFVETSSGAIVLPLAMTTRASVGGGPTSGGDGGDVVYVMYGEPRDEGARVFCTFEGGDGGVPMARGGAGGGSGEVDV